MEHVDILKLPAIEIRQGLNRIIYSFSVDGKQIDSFASVSRVVRDEEKNIQGYQRPEVLGHIAEIRSYLESEDPLIPNSIVIAFDETVSFVPSNRKTGDASGYTRIGHLEIPVNKDWSEVQKPGWIVDGQQRTAAIRDAKVASFPMPVNAFIAGGIDEQRSQFILVNSTKPLPKGLIYELLPTTTGKLSSAFQKKRFPASLLSRLNHDEDSPFRNMIKTPTVPDGVIQDNSILKMIENSLAEGVLYRFRDPSTGEGDSEEMLRALKSYWEAVSEVFPDAWSLPPRKSRLTHGAGIVGMGHIMDAIADWSGWSKVPTKDEFKQDIEPLKEVCRWTRGYWDFGPGQQRKWNELQNTSKDVQILTNYLLVQYRRLVWSTRQSA
jgi:DGQHR domain-containing protein